MRNAFQITFPSGAANYNMLVLRVEWNENGAGEIKCKAVHLPNRVAYNLQSVTKNEDCWNFFFANSSIHLASD